MEGNGWEQGTVKLFDASVWCRMVVKASLDCFAWCSVVVVMVACKSCIYT